jgi:hypothetical protein
VEGPSTGGTAGRLSLRDIARRIFHVFRYDIARVADAFTLRLIGSVLGGRTPSLLDLADRPAAYEDVGRLCRWERVFPAHALSRSRYERVLTCALSGARLRRGRDVLTPIGMRGWSRVLFRRESDGAREMLTIDALLAHLDAWER